MPKQLQTRRLCLRHLPSLPRCCQRLSRRTKRKTKVSLPQQSRFLAHSGGQARCGPLCAPVCLLHRSASKLLVSSHLHGLGLYQNPARVLLMLRLAAHKGRYLCAATEHPPLATTTQTSFFFSEFIKFLSMLTQQASPLPAEDLELLGGCFIAWLSPRFF